MNARIPWTEHKSDLELFRKLENTTKTGQRKLGKKKMGNDRKLQGKWGLKGHLYLN